MYTPDYAAALAASELPRKDELVKLVRPAVQIHASEVDHDCALGGSRIGGMPDLPPEICWPVWEDQPIPFIAQLDLAEIPDFAERGLLPARL